MAKLDDAYANSAYIDGAEAYPGRWAAAAEAYRAALADRATLGVSYGPSERQAFDVFLPEDAPDGVCMFVHGGYWLKFDRSYWSHLAAGANARGWAVVMPSYDLAPQVPIAEITQQIACAVLAMAERFEGPITLTGHSAGGHLVARMLAPGLLPENVVARIKRVVPISPVADLRPLLKTSMNEDFGLDPAGAEAESPVLQPAPSVPVSVWVGGQERPAFLDQARWLAQAWGAEHVEVPGKHHFDVIDALAYPASDLVARLT
ncbi:alpha/beta hydrolase [Aliishimia ponticola]|uniref:Alpha/beta hydrolase n=1 Tax=Aliishimia ponticola TaxID=2499833 RepID=A0A4S4NA67_9RHOB|nr:alpha/beta hydrolase [Aliishimia ponticola]THH36184.1 alpha/beta hydrolase [Aliishimia ponticola]